MSESCTANLVLGSESVMCVVIRRVHSNHPSAPTRSGSVSSAIRAPRALLVASPLRQDIMQLSKMGPREPPTISTTKWPVVRTQGEPASRQPGCLKVLRQHVQWAEWVTGARRTSRDPSRHGGNSSRACTSCDCCVHVACGTRRSARRSVSC